jgi:hypothetical protein
MIQVDHADSVRVERGSGGGAVVISACEIMRLYDEHNNKVREEFEARCGQAREQARKVLDECQDKAHRTRIVHLEGLAMSVAASLGLKMNEIALYEEMVQDADGGVRMKWWFDKR